ncbi:MAG: hypothetical protein HY801_07710 [Candidatus Lindowbacteria bacterium]|nr:hypothetical protein [Candidatus Lindowbacteria bacterium]
MQAKPDSVAVERSAKALIAKAILGGVAAATAMLLMRVIGSREVLVALFIGLVPGIAEKSFRKVAAGAILGIFGYVVGARISLVIARSLFGVPLGLWSVTGAFIGLTAGILYAAQSTPFRLSIRLRGCVYGFLFGLMFGILGDIGGYFTIVANRLGFGFGLFYYMTEFSLLCAGIFINLGVALATAFSESSNRHAARSAEKAAC